MRSSFPTVAAVALAVLAIAPATAAPAHTTQEFPPLWNEPKDYQQALHRQLAQVDARVARGPFAASWRSLAAYQVPTWFRDAKFGIFIHWGVFSVPAFNNEWYSRNMYVKGSAPYEYHRAVYGPQAKFGYKDFIPRFTMAKFDPDAWADLFVRAGARYVVPVAEHSDGFAMYDSKFTLWDAARMGPKRDVIAALEKAVRARGLRFGVSSHRAEHWWWYHEGTEYASDVDDPRYAGLYGPAEPMHLPGDDTTGEPDPSHLERWLPPSQPYVDDWLARSTELVDDYHPDFIYFDWWINQPAFAPDLKRMAAYYYDVAAARHQGVVLTYKLEAFPPGAAVLDIERGKLDALRLLPWQSDTSVSINSWGYVKDDDLPHRGLAAHGPDRRREQERQSAAQCRAATPTAPFPRRSGRCCCRWARGCASTARPSTVRGRGCCTARARPMRHPDARPDRYTRQRTSGSRRKTGLCMRWGWHGRATARC